MLQTELLQRETEHGLQRLRSKFSSLLAQYGFHPHVRAVGDPLFHETEVEDQIRISATSETHPGDCRGILIVRMDLTQVHLCLFPSLRPDHGPCPECLDRRLVSMMTPSEQQALRDGTAFAENASPYLLSAEIERICLLARMLLKGDVATTKVETRNIYTFDLLTMAIDAYELLADSFCSRCSLAPAQSTEAASLQLRSRVPATGGSGRVKSLRDYNFPMKALVNPACGAVAKHTVPGAGRSITAPTFGQYVQRSHSGYGRFVIWCGMHSRRSESVIAGILEGLERQAGMFADPARTVCIDSFENLGARAMDPALSLDYSDESYTLPFELTRYTPQLPLEWIHGYSVSAQRSILVPRQLAFYEKIHADEVKVVQNNSSGCALGSCYEEAILKGLLELIERDSFVLAWHRQLALPRIDARSSANRKTRAVLDRVELLGYDLTLLDGRLDMGIPIVIAIARRRDRELGALSVGAAASMDLDDALLSAALEASTAIVELPLLIKNNEAHVHSLVEDFTRVKEVADHAFIYGLPEMADRIRWLVESPVLQSMSDRSAAANAWKTSSDGGDIAADLERCMTELHRVGCPELVVVDLTTLEQRTLGLVTVRVLVPGLAPIDFGHPRHRVARLPRMQLPSHLQQMSVAGNAMNPLPHPFP